MDKEMRPEDLARLFHSLYENKSTSFGYVTRGDTRMFDKDSPNGKLMIDVCKDILNLLKSMEDKMDENYERHFYLYAKGHYDEKDITLEDIHSHYALIEKKYVDKEMMANVLLDITYPHIKNIKHFILTPNFTNINLGDTFIIGHYENIIEKCLFILKFTKKDDIPFDLGEADLWKVKMEVDDEI